MAISPPRTTVADALPSSAVDVQLQKLDDLVHQHADIFAVPQASSSTAPAKAVREQSLITAQVLLKQGALVHRIALQDEAAHLPAFADLYLRLNDNGFSSDIVTRSKAAAAEAKANNSKGKGKGKGKAKKPTVASLLANDPLFRPTPLSELYWDQDAASQNPELTMQALWYQIQIKLQQSLNMYNALVGDEDDMGIDEVEGVEEDDSEELEDSDGMDQDVAQIDSDEEALREGFANGSDDEEGFDEDDMSASSDEKLTQDEEDDSGSNEDPIDVPIRSEPYFAKLRDAEDGKHGIANGQPRASTSKVTLDSSEPGKRKSRNRKKGKGKEDVETVAGETEVDAGFFSLKDFNSQSLQGEEEMRRYMGSGKSKSVNDIARGLDGLEDDDDDENEDIDYFAPAGSSGAGSDEDEELEEDLDGAVRPEDMRYDDFWMPPSKLYGNAKDKDTFGFSDDGTARKNRPKTKEGHTNGSTSDKPAVNGAPAKGKRRVSFHEDVKVKEIENTSAQSAVAALVRKMGMKAALKKMSEPGFDFDDVENMYEDEEEDDEALDEDSDGDEEDSDDAEPDENMSQEEGSDIGDDMEDIDAEARTMQRLNRDLLSDDTAETSTSKSQKARQAQQSRHEQRMAALSEQIEQLEQENVSERDWVLKGEVGSRARPVNSLLEEDLEFEQVAKVVPIVTEETSQSLEDKIKKRILDDNFDDVVRKRPVESAAYLPSRLLDIKDTQSDRSLAEIYADEFGAERSKVNGEGQPIAEVDTKLQKEHDSIKAIFDDVCSKLDALSNAHFTPKAVQTSITTISNLPSLSMESATPTATSASTLLAPEEVYAPAQNGTLTSKSEMTPSQKKAARAKNRKMRAKTIESIQKYGGATSSMKKAKDRAMNSLVGKRGVTVIGKGKAAKSALTGKDRSNGQVNGTAPGSAASYKL